MSSSITEVIFLPSTGQQSPYIVTLLHYTCDGREGTILFEGQYDINDTDLPQTMDMTMRRSELVLLPSSLFGMLNQSYTVVEEDQYTISIHTVQKHTQLKHINKYTLRFRTDAST